jgi:F-type H+-transporting ATPase subunit gamma
VAGQEGIEGIRARLNNIRSVEPILGAMRTISLGSWQASLKRKERVLAYSERLLMLLPAVVPLLPARRRRAKGARPHAPSAVAVIGSERGLCGAFNSTLVRYAEVEFGRFQDLGVEVELQTLGSRVTRMLERLDYDTAWSRSLPMTSLPTSALAHELTQSWLDRYERYELDAVYLVYNAYRNSTSYEPMTLRLIPPPLPSPDAHAPDRGLRYVDTDPVQLYTRAIVLWVTTEVYRVLLDAAAAEHSARYRLMEGATQNASRLVNELTMALQSARQHAITSEMQELAAGAGLLDSQGS